MLLDIKCCSVRGIRQAVPDRMEYPPHADGASVSDGDVGRYLG
jgi:hypothetical protein